jgi:hypothetical protein
MKADLIALSPTAGCSYYSVYSITVIFDESISPTILFQGKAYIMASFYILSPGFYHSASA